MPSKTWYAMAQKSAGNAEISIYEEIGAWGISAKQFSNDLKALGDVINIDLRLNSPGGSVFDGIAIYNLLTQHKAQITVHVDGLAASMASVIAMAGDLVIAPENSMIMIHNPWTLAYGDAEELRKNADLLDKVRVAMLSAYRDKTGLSDEQLIQMMDDETWMTGAEALAHGFVDIVDVAVDMAACSKFDLSSFRKSSLAVANINQRKEGVMPDIVNATAAVDVEKMKAEIMAAEESRKAEIVAAFGNFADQHSELLMKCLIDSKVSADQARAKLLNAIGAQSGPPTPGFVTVAVGGSASERFINDGVEAILARAGFGQASSSNPLRGLRLDAIAYKSLEIAGGRFDGMAPMQIVGSAFTQTSSDFPVLLENAMHKVLQTAYAEQPDTWSRFCATGSVSDFRAHNRYRVGSFGNLDTLTEAGEYRNKAIPDGEKSSITASTKGNIINLTRKAIIDDDLGAFINLAASLGRAGRRTIESDVYALLALNSGLGPTMGDSKTLFHADHGNIGTNTALTVSGIEADRVLMAMQKDVGGNGYLDLRPEVLLVPMSLGGTARIINSAEYDPDTANKLQKPNMVRGLFSDVVDTPRMTGTRRYLFANSTVAPVIEVAFLNGDQGPFLESENGFTVDGVRWKVRLDYGVGAIDYRGAVTNSGT